MISQFWNLCRACPAVDVDKLHSEYRSTYRWYEYTPKQNQVVRRPPQPIAHSGIDGAEFPRKKKHPEIAYKSHDFFDPNAVAHPTRASRHTERESSSGMQRRSQSEGPVTRNPLFQSEYRLQFASSRKARERSHDTEEIRPQEPKPTVSYPPPAPSSAWSRRQASLKFRDAVADRDREGREPKKSISMGQIQQTGNQPSSGQIQAASSSGGLPAQASSSQQHHTAAAASSTPAPAHTQQLTQATANSSSAHKSSHQESSVLVHDVNGNADTVDGRTSTPHFGSPAHIPREYKSEYKNKYRPFSQYEYVGDGKFFNTSNSPPSEVDGPTSLVSLHSSSQKVEKLEGEPWYKEVQELRKVANDYKCRGWGTDLVPPHMSQLYNQQLNLHEQAAKRESLSALALAISTPRSMKKDEKDKANERKMSPAPIRLSRPKTAPAKSKKSQSRPESAAAGANKENQANSGSISVTDSPCRAPLGSKKDTVSGGTVHRKTPDPAKTTVKRQRPTTLETSKHKTSSKPKDEVVGAKSKPGHHDTAAAATTKKEEAKPVLQEKSGPSKTIKTTAAAASKPPAAAKQDKSAAAARKVDVKNEGKRGPSRSSSKAVSRDPSRPPSAIENQIDYFREPVVKSPPEPTRVKSPEQLLIRSPDPINWTVPLDTGKTFSVTQSVRDSDSARNSPMSDHSSHFDSVSGTAINLGNYAVNEKGSLQYPKVSALAREAKELQGLTNNSGNKDSQPKEDSKEGKGLNGHSVNGTHEPVVKITAAAANPTTIKCLDDPNFSFDEAPIGGGAANNNKEESNAVPSSQQPTAAENNCDPTAAAAASSPAPPSTTATPPQPTTVVTPPTAPQQQPSLIPQPTSAASKPSPSPQGPASSSDNMPNLIQAEKSPEKSSAAANKAPVSAAPSGIPVPLALPAAGSSSATPDIPVSAPPTVKKPSYRVLEDPDLELPKPKGSPYKVLEDPGMMTASIYMPSNKAD